MGTAPAWILRVGMLLTITASALLLEPGCRSAGRVPSPVQSGLNTAYLIDPLSQLEADELNAVTDLYQLAESIRAARKPEHLPPKRTLLALSGGGSYGAYSAGVLVGWSEVGTRPVFDVVTGISTGALIAPFAFLGSAYDQPLERFYTTLRDRDLFRIDLSLLAESLADTTPLERKIEQTITRELIAEIACEHARGRRLYVGTTELEGRRQVIWDMGAIAQRGTPAARTLFRKILLASASIPGFFPPVRIPVNIDGRRLEERHVDGGVSTSLFIRPPYIPPEQRGEPQARSLYGTDLYIIVAGKLFADPEPVRPRFLAIAGTSVSAITYAQARGDLVRLYTVSILSGMNYFLTAIPREFSIPSSSTDFEPKRLRRMFEEGRRQVHAGTVWRLTPPGVEPGETPLSRSGTQLTRVPEFHYSP